MAVRRLHAIGYVERVLLVVHTFREEGPRRNYADYLSA